MNRWFVWIDHLHAIETIFSPSCGDFKMLNLSEHKEQLVRRSGFYFLTLLVLLIICRTDCRAEYTHPVGRDRVKIFAQTVEQLRETFNIPGLSVAVLHNQRIQFAKGFGYADIENRIAATADTPYNIASLTKSIAAAVLMQLVEEGQIHLDDKIADILKDTEFHYRGDTYRGYSSVCKKIKAAQHSTSFPLFQDYRCDTEKITVKHHLTHTAQGDPGDIYRYNGFLYGMLSYVAAESSGKSFKELLVTKIVNPLKMTGTLPNGNRKRSERILGKRSQYYRVNDTGEFVASAYSTDLSAAAGMTSTVRDLAKFDIAMDRNLIVSQASKSKMFTSAISSNGRALPYGLGWFVQERRGVKLVWHYGWAPNAYSSLILKIPDENLTLIILANSDGASAPFDLGKGNVLTSPFAIEFLDLFTNLKAEIPVTGSIKNVHEPGNTNSTYIDVMIGRGFTGKLPDDIDSITVSGPSGVLPISKEDFTYFGGLRDFWFRLPGPPQIGTYTFTVSGRNRKGTSTDTQSQIRTIPLPDTRSFVPADVSDLRSRATTFSWAAVDSKFPLYYRLDIRKLRGGSIYKSGYVKGMLRHSIPEGILEPEKDYRWRIRIVDSHNWIDVQNRSHSTWQHFRIGRIFETLHKSPDKPGAFPGPGWDKIKDPELLGWSSSKLAAARRYSEQIGSAAVMIVEDGIVVDAWGDVARNYMIHSMRKPLMSALIGIHVDRGNIRLTKTMAQLGIDDNEPSLTEIEKQATVADLIKSRSGIYHPALGEALVMKAVRPARHSHAPGSFYYYNNWDFNAIGTIFEQETGTRIFEEFQRQIAGPLQMEDFNLDRCWYENGNESLHRYYGMRMSARDLARFGLLYLREGRWRDRQVVPADWVQESTATHSRICAYMGYGYMWRTSENGGPYHNINVKARNFGHSGLGVHFFMVIPSRNLVIVHRVNTDLPGPYPTSNQLGRLLWLILDAAGETDIGENPSIDAAAGQKITEDNYKKVLGRDTVFASGLTPAGLVERSAPTFTVSMYQNGTLSVKGGIELTGRWWFQKDKFCIQRNQAMTTCHPLLLDHKSLKFYSLDGTLDFKLTILP